MPVCGERRITRIARLRIGLLAALLSMGACVDSSAPLRPATGGDGGEPDGTGASDVVAPADVAAPQDSPPLVDVGKVEDSSSPEDAVLSADVLSLPDVIGADTGIDSG